VTREVVLAPGLWMPGTAMAVMAARLSRAGYSPHVFTYRGRSPFETNVARFARYVREKLAGQAAHFIGHSLGGVLVLDMLNSHPEVATASAVLLGAPVRGCLAGRRLGRARMGRWMMGACGVLWNEREARWRREAPLGVIAGTRPLGLGRVLGRMPDDNDGVVRVEETTVAGMTARALVPHGHSMLVLAGSVMALIERFLASGRF
jgi:pimeloyl-ACP methyl ester carboxylesterase